MNHLHPIFRTIFDQRYPCLASSESENHNPSPSGSSQQPASSAGETAGTASEPNAPSPFSTPDDETEMPDRFDGLYA